MTVTTKSTSLALRYSKTLADLSTKVGANREITVCDEDKRPYLHDGVTAGGIPLAMKSELGASLTGAQIVSLIDAELGSTDWRTGGGAPSPAPVITSQPSAHDVKAPAAATFSVTATNATSYQWYLDDVVITGETSSTLSIPDSTGLNGNVYKVDVIGSTTVTSSSVTLTVEDPKVYGPTITISNIEVL